MKRTSFIAFIILSSLYFFYSCNDQYKSTTLGKSTIKGNVFWKYNNYVGNRPDAGCDIFICSTNSKFSTNTKADVQGNFSFEHIPDGEYFIMLSSNTVHENPVNNLRLIARKRDIIETLKLYNFSSINDSLPIFFAIDSSYNAIIAIDSHSSKKKNIIKKLEEERQAIAIKLLSKLFISGLDKDFGNSNLPVVLPFSALYIDTKNVRDGGVENVIVDYGLTYY